MLLTFRCTHSADTTMSKFCSRRSAWTFPDKFKLRTASLLCTGTPVLTSLPRFTSFSLGFGPSGLQLITSIAFHTNSSYCTLTNQRAFYSSAHLLGQKGCISTCATSLVVPGLCAGCPARRLNRVLLDLEHLRLFNIGMRNASAIRRSESYRTLAGPNVGGDTIELADRRRYRRGHWFGSAIDNSVPVTIGLSAGSKVWSNASSQIPKLTAWCKRLARKIASDRVPVTNSGLDHLPTGEEMDRIPDGVVYVDWNESAYLQPTAVLGTRPDGREGECQLLDLDLFVDRARSNREAIVIRAVGPDAQQKVIFRLEGNPVFFEADGAEVLRVRDGDALVGISTYLNRHWPTFYTSTCASFEGCNYFDPVSLGLVRFRPIELRQSTGWPRKSILRRNSLMQPTASATYISTFGIA